jgi:hypothetical protein
MSPNDGRGQRGVISGSPEQPGAKTRPRQKRPGQKKWRPAKGASGFETRFFSWFLSPVAGKRTKVVDRKKIVRSPAEVARPGKERNSIQTHVHPRQAMFEPRRPLLDAALTASTPVLGVALAPGGARLAVTAQNAAIYIQTV